MRGIRYGRERLVNELHKKIPDNPLAFLIRNRLINVTPGDQGDNCLAYQPGDKCACDECEYFQMCRSSDRRE